ncbi:similar to Saccharomyces cerevisiae YGR158C MTR3 Exosome non-catalytic core component [Maudiozyma barnettii]|uniref:Similar to Saccharomyces cerevisiae YGR158C MTR3 Exosome non-catalytic core component n=1 Tax=Maudiozyma barnettii TaxID=61262 RepID=A0A8H2VJ79_9SACH|nr:exosome non-catalytic core subunit MTR3 [Kazachstania barnettii]CAB4256565.1 similar to Saccharomyces cerevisiae YGR158C MTR3 Exosome non-catalytic core component [Kazachstania barnettii]CAD1785168.1 similar to Saccharomyces cerevisiae YGR158C MTR3 Exosome non-catalytic core component [Kazachstania barnettii]
MNVQDRRRILGPIEARPLAFPEVKSNSKEETAVVLSEFQAPSIQTTLLKNCNGSCIIENDKTSILSSIYGPRSTRSNLFEARCLINVTIKSTIFPTSELKELGSFLINVLESFVCLELYPKAGIDVFVNLNIEKVCDLSWYIPYIMMSIVLGLVDAGIEISDLPGCGFNDNNAICFTKNGSEVIGIWRDKGDIENESSFGDSLDACKEQYLQIKGLMANYLLSKLDNDKTK